MGVLRLIALVRVGVGWIELQILDRFGVSCPRNPLEDPKVRGLAQDLLRLLEVDTRKLNDDPVGPLGPDDPQVDVEYRLADGAELVALLALVEEGVAADRLGQAVRVREPRSRERGEEAVDDVYRHVACLCGDHPGADVRDLELEVRATLEVEALVHEDRRVEPQEWDRERGRALERSGQRLVGRRPIDVGESVDEERKERHDADQEKQAAVDAHRAQV